MCLWVLQVGMPGGGGRSGSRSVGFLGAIVALIAVVGYLGFGWSWGSSNAIPTAVGIVVGASVIGWSFYKVESLTAGL